MTRRHWEGLAIILLVLVIVGLNLLAYGKWGLLSIPWFGFFFWAGVQSKKSSLPKTHCVNHKEK